MKRLIGTITALIAAALFLLAIIFFKNVSPKILDGLDGKETVSSPADPECVLHGPYKVVYVVDGDTAVINIDGAEARVRFIGVDTPESVNPDESKNVPEGKVASDFTKALLTDKSVYLEYDVDKTDDYGRTLAYVYLDNGSTMVQTRLLAAGMATTMTIQPNSKYAAMFYSTMYEARESKQGFWATGFFTD